MMKVMYSSLLEDDLIIVGQTSTFVCRLEIWLKIRRACDSLFGS